MIHDLSYPKGNSINSFIPDEFCKVQYENLYNVVELVQKFGQGSFIAKVDIEEAFRIIPIRPVDYHLLGFKLDNE